MKEEVGDMPMVMVVVDALVPAGNKKFFHFHANLVPIIATVVVTAQVFYFFSSLLFS